MKRARSIAAIVAAIALTVTACGGEEAASSGATDPNSVSGTVTWWDTSDATNEAPAYGEIVASFQAKYPKIKVNHVNVPFDGASDKFKTAAQSGNGAPDVMRTDVGWTPTFAKLGYLQPLDGTTAVSAPEDYLPGAMETNKIDGKTYGVPAVTDTLALMYNKKLFEQAGITEPPTTWEQVRTSAQQIEQKVPGTTGIFVHADAYYLLPFVYGQSGDFVDEAAKKITIGTEQVLAAVNTAKDLAADGTGATDPGSNGYTNMQNGFKNGTTAMVLNGPWATRDYFSGSAFTDRANLGVAPIPAGPSGKGGPVGGHNLTIYAGSQNLDASYLFVDFMTSAENQAKVAAKNNTMPTRASVYELPEIKANPVIAAFQQPQAEARPRPKAPGSGDLYDMLTPYYQQIMGGQVAAQDGLQQAQQKSDGYVPGFAS